MREHVLERPLRVLFVGREVEERRWTLTGPADGVVGEFLDHRSRDLVAKVSAKAPDVVVVFSPQRLAAGVAAQLPGRAIAVLADNVEIPSAENGSPWSPEEITRAGEPVARVLAGFDVAEYDRVVATDPRVARLSSGVDLWRCPPLPVDDALYRSPPALAPDARALFVGESTPYREAYLVGAKHHYDLRHYAFGLGGEHLQQVLDETSIGVVVSPGRWTTFEAAAAMHLAAGHLLLASPLDPPRGLEAGLDHISFQEPEDLLHVLFDVRSRPAAFEQVRRRGRVRAEEFRASRIWPRLVKDLMLDLEAFGTRRTSS